MTASGASQIAAAFAGLLWPVLATGVYFASKGSLGAMLAGWLWPLQNYSGANETPYGWVNMGFRAWDTLYGSPSWAERAFNLFVTSPVFIVPVLPFLALLVVAIHVRRLRAGARFEGSSASQYYVLCGGFILGLTLSAVSTGRPDFDHLLYLAPPLFLVFAWIFQEGNALPSRFLDRVRPLLAVFVLVSFTAFGLAFWLRGAVTTRSSLETTRGTVRVTSPDKVVLYLARHVQPGSQIFVYPYQPLYYFLSSTFSASRYDFLQLGMHTREQLAEAARDLAENKPGLVLYGPSFNYLDIPIIWPGTPPEVAEKDPVRDYILQNYRYCRSLVPRDWEYYVMVRRDLECPR